MTKQWEKAKRLLAAGMALCLLAACSALPDADTGPVRGAPAADAPLTGQLTVCLDANYASELANHPIWQTLKQFGQENPQLTLTFELIAGGYNQPDIREAQIARIGTEVMAGGGPDVFLFSYRTTDLNLFPDLQKTMRSGAFLDCGPLLNARGIDLANDFWPCLMRAGQAGGAQYILPLSFDITVGLASAETLAGANFDEAAAAKSVQGLMMQLALAHQSDPALSSMMEAELVTNLETPLLDYDAGTVHLSDEPVRQALELGRAAERARGAGGWNQGTSDSIEEYNKPGRESFVYREAERLASGRRLMDMQSFSLLCRQAWVLAALGSRPRFLPMPNESGGTTAMVTSSAAVSANTQNPEAAAALLAFLLGEEQQARGAFPVVLADLPVRRNCLATGIESCRLDAAHIWWLDPTAEEIRLWEELFGETWKSVSEQEKQEYLLTYGGPLPEAAVKELEAICGRITAAHLQSLWYDSAVDLGDDLIAVTHRDYLNGEMTLDELIETLEPRLQLYLDE